MGNKKALRMEILSTKNSTFYAGARSFDPFVLCNVIYYTFSLGLWQAFTYPDILVEYGLDMDHN